MKTQLAKIDALMEELRKLPPVKGSFKRKLEEKYRIAWNYHSNHIEGNTLTYGQTQLLLIRGRSIGDHETRNYEEMKAHDVAVDLIKEWAADKNRNITERDLRELNKLILVEPFWKEAITPDGGPTRKKIIPGSYKTSPNSVQLQNGQMHEYPSPAETPALMEELMKWYNEQFDEHPLVQAAFVHHRLTEIHPFDDGNGRVARLWANFILLKADYPPLIVRTENKDQYLASLALADYGNLEDFVEFLGSELQWSIEVAIKAARGEDIEEDADLDKRLALLKKEIDSEEEDNEIKTRLKPAAIKKTLDDWGYDLFNELAMVTAKFNDFYDNPQHQFNFSRSGGSGRHEIFTNKINFDNINSSLDAMEPDGEIFQAEFALRTNFGIYKKGGLQSFGCMYSLEVKYELYSYEIFISKFNPEVNGQNLASFSKKLLHQSISKEDIKQLSKDWGELLLQHLEYARKRLKGNKE